jgi:hypothetical protein
MAASNEISIRCTRSTSPTRVAAFSELAVRSNRHIANRPCREQRGDAIRGCYFQAPPPTCMQPVGFDAAFDAPGDDNRGPGVHQPDFSDCGSLTCHRTTRPDEQPVRQVLTAIANDYRPARQACRGGHRGRYHVADAGGALPHGAGVGRTVRTGLPTCLVFVSWRTPFVALRAYGGRPRVTGRRRPAGEYNGRPSLSISVQRSSVSYPILAAGGPRFGAEYARASCDADRFARRRDHADSRI